MSLEDLLKRVTEAGEGRTPGPWFVKPMKGYTDDYILTSHPDWAPSQEKKFRNYVGECGLAGGQTEQRFSQDAAFIVALENAWPEIEALLRALISQKETAE